MDRKGGCSELKVLYSQCCNSYSAYDRETGILKIKYCLLTTLNKQGSLQGQAMPVKLCDCVVRIGRLLVVICKVLLYIEEFNFKKIVECDECKTYSKGFSFAYLS